MCEGRRSQIVLLDERRLDLIIQPKLYAGELLDLVASHFHLKEKEYFGIAYYPQDSSQFSWLQLDKRVLEHDLPKKPSTSSHSSPPVLTLYFRVKYFVESITQLGESATVEAFYLQAKSLLAKGELEGDSETIFQLAALVLQATYGDFIDESIFRAHLRRLPILPASTLKEYPSISECEERVLHYYRNLAGQPRGAAIVNYLTIVESLPTYGQHYYEIKDKTNTPCYLGLSYKGISQYDRTDRRNPKRVFLWKQLENLYYRDKKFTIEVHEARRVVHTLSSFNLYEDAIEEPAEDYDDLSDAICDPTTQVSVSRRTLAPANVTVYVWYASSPIVAKCIWSMAIAQHHFFLDRRHRKSQASVVPTLTQIASELCKSVQSLSSAGSHSNISRSTSTSSLPSTILGGEISEESKAATIEMLTALRARKEALEEALKKKTEELKSLCLKEGELTGEIPAECPLQPGESKPQVRRRIGTSFSLSDKLICKVKSKERETLSDLELEYEIQSKIASAAFQLANDCTARKSVRKQRKISYIKATDKLRAIEQKICTLQRERKKAAEKLESKSLNGGDEIDSPARKADELDAASLHGTQESSISSHSDGNSTVKSGKSSSSVPPCNSFPQLTVTPCDDGSPVIRSQRCHRQRHQSLQHIPGASPNDRTSVIHDPCEWSVSSSCSPNGEFDSVSCSSGTLQPPRVPYRNRFECRLDIEGSNLYSVPNRRASQIFDSQDDLLLNSRKNEFDRKSPAAKIPVNRPECTGSTFPLSSSYDEHMWYGNPSNLECFSNNSSFERSFTNNKYDTLNSNRTESYHQKKLPIESQRNSPKLHHFHSENSLNNDELSFVSRHLENSHISESDLVDSVHRKKIAHVQSVPHLPEAMSSSKSSRDHHHHHPKSMSSSNHSIKQVADLVSASMLLQDSKRMASSNLSVCYSPSKVKTKEWIETSLDSPLPSRKQKPKPVYESQLTNDQNCPTSATGCSSPYPNMYNAHHHLQVPTLQRNQCCNHLQQDAYDNYSHNRDCPHSFESSQTLIYSTNNNVAGRDPMSVHWPVEKNSSSNNSYVYSNTGRCFQPNESPNEGFMYHHHLNSSDSGRNISSMYNEYGPQEIGRPKSPYYVNVYQDQPPKLEEEAPLSVHYAGDSHTCGVDRHPSEETTMRYVHRENDSYQHQNHVRHDQVHTALATHVSPSQYGAQNDPAHGSLNSPGYADFPCSSPYSDSIGVRDIDKSDAQFSPVCHYSTETVINVPQETIVPLPSCDTSNFPFTGNVEVNVVTVGHFQPYWEETKPYELSDFYKYSTKHRKPHQNCSDSESTSQPNSPHVTLDGVMNERHIPDVTTGQVPCGQVASSDSMYRNTCDELTSKYASSPPNSAHEIIVNAHVAAVVDHPNDCSDIQNHNSYNQELNANPVSSPPLSGDENGSFGEILVPNSLADAFQREMMAWYDNRDRVKKATFV